MAALNTSQKMKYKGRELPVHENTTVRNILNLMKNSHYKCMKTKGQHVFFCNDNI